MPRYTTGAGTPIAPRPGSWPDYLPRPQPMHASPPPAQGAQLGSGKVWILVASTLAVVLVGGLLVGSLSSSRTAARPTTRPLVGRATPSASATPQQTWSGATPAPYPTPDPMLLPSARPGTKVVRIGLSLPLYGKGLEFGGPARDGVLAALVNAGSANGYVIQPVIVDNTVDGVETAQGAANSIQTLAIDDSVVGVVGPLGSEAARAQIPIATQHHLLECSPGATDAGLTRGSSALALRSADPAKPTFLRVAATDDSEAVAIALWAEGEMPTSQIGVVSDSTGVGLRLATTFEATLNRTPGILYGRYDSTPGEHDYLATLSAWTTVGAIFYGGTSPDEAAAIRLQMDASGLADALLLTAGGVYDSAWAGMSAYLHGTGHSAALTRAARAIRTDYSGRSGFEYWYQGAVRQPVGDYSAAAFACAQVIIDAITKVAAHGPVTREAVREAAMDPAATVQSVFGQLTFDANGDNRTQAVTIYGASPSTDGPSWHQLPQVVVGLCPGVMNPPCFPGASSSAPPGTSPAPSAAPTPSPSPSSSPSPSPTTSPTASGASTGTILRIGVSVPLSGDSGAVGRSVRDAVLAAIVQAAAVPGDTIEPVVMDTTSFDFIDAPKATAARRS